ncbi:hypothetical protein [Catenuloplanes atrovinosus]|uniref:Uncharacterized protein n=1 Tax=Catenuloplanes atrovinosus TaxID=137266 RepID=A0AAE3YNS2_9ACTN|nr:hypothetical protein [Catenuloplanes atrovinosus]MDR7276427.1 hypothetical protein [Catenuloplanes atrovinosus]
MMPQLVTVRVDRAGRRPVRAWVPVLPLALLLGPLVVLAAVVACLIFRVHPTRALAAGWRVLSALPGTRFHLGQGRTGLLVTIR